MHTQAKISALALAVAIAAAPAPAFAQLNLGVDLDLGADSSGLGIGAGVDLGIGGQNLNVDAGVGVGGDSLVDANVDIGGSSTDSSGTSNSGGISVDAEVLGDDSLVDADVQLGTGAQAAPAPAPASGTPLANARISALDDAARVNVLIDRIGVPDLAGVDLDGVIDDTRVSIVALADLLGSDDLADVRATIEAGGPGREELLAAIDASVELGAILDRNGLSSDDVVALSIDANGAAELVVLDLGIDLADAQTGEAPLLDTDLAALDIDLLTDDELAEVDLALLPREDQRLDAIVRILGNDADADAADGDIELVEVDALLGDEALAELDAVLGGSDTETVLVTADLLDVLGDAGLSPEAVIGVDTRPDRATRVFVNTGLGDTGLITGDLAQVDLSIGTGSIGGGDPGDGAGSGNDGDGSDAGNGNGDGSGDGSGSGNGSGSGTGNGGQDDGTSGGSADAPLVNPNGSLTTGLPAALLDVQAVVAEVSCAAGLGALSAAPAPTPSDLRHLSAVSFVTIEGCAAILRQDDLEALRSAVGAMPALRQGIDRAGLTLDDLVGGTLDQGNLTLYFDAEGAAA